MRLYVETASSTRPRIPSARPSSTASGTRFRRRCGPDWAIASSRKASWTARWWVYDSITMRGLADAASTRAALAQAKVADASDEPETGYGSGSGARVSGLYGGARRGRARGSSRATTDEPTEATGRRGY